MNEFKVGDRVRCLTWAAPYEGTISRQDERNDNLFYIRLVCDKEPDISNAKEDGSGAMEKGYYVYQFAREIELIQRFEVGDEVKIIEDNFYHGFPIGATVTLLEQVENFAFLAQNENGINKYVGNIDIGPVEKYLNTWVICIKEGLYHTAGKKYQIKNGRLNDNDNKFDYARRIRDLSDLDFVDKPRFIPYMGEQE